MADPRIPPLPVTEWDPELASIVTGVTSGGRRPLNIFATLAHHPALMRRWLVFANHVLGKSTLSPRDREILILRTGWRCRSEYEWGQHVLIARDAGMSDEEIAAVVEGDASPLWSDHERLLVRAADELHDEARVGDETWAALSAHYDTRQMMDVVFAVGQYHLVAFALNSFGVQRDEGVPGLPG